MLPIRITVWNKNIHEQTHELVRSIYPQGRHGCIADSPNECEKFQARTVERAQQGGSLHKPGDEGVR